MPSKSSTTSETEREQRLAKLRSQQHDLFLEQQRLEVAMNQQNNKGSIHFPNPPLRNAAKQSHSSFMSASSGTNQITVTAPSTPTHGRTPPTPKEHSPVNANILSHDTTNVDTDMQDRSSGNGSGSEESPVSAVENERKFKTSTAPTSQQSHWSNQNVMPATTMHDVRTSTNSTPTKFDMMRQRNVSSGKGITARPRNAPPSYPLPHSPTASSANHASIQVPQQSVERQSVSPTGTTDMATDFEVSALRAQVAQLQFALKKQMSNSTTAGPVPSRLLNELTGLPTPEESMSGGSTLSFANRSATNNNNTRQQQQGSIASGDGRDQDRMLYDLLNERQRDLSRMNSQRQFHGSDHPDRSTRNGLSRNAFMTSRETFGGGGGGCGGSELGGQRSMWDSASTFARPEDQRVDELSAKLDRLEQLFRMTAIQQQQQGSGASRIDDDPRRPVSPFDQRRNVTSRDQYQGHERREANLMSHQFSNYSMNHPYDGQFRAPSMADSQQGSQFGSHIGSVRTKSPAASAFHYNATPYQQYLARGGSNVDFSAGSINGGVGEAIGETSLPSSKSGGDGGSDLRVDHRYDGHYTGPLRHKASSASSIGAGTGSISRGSSHRAVSIAATKSAHIEHYRRKGVARFILGSTASKVIDPVPSYQASLSYNRTERVEKPANTRMKAAGRGRVVVVEKKQKS